MKKFTLLSLVGITSIALAHTGWAAGHGGGGGGFGGGGGGGFHGGGGGFHGGGAAHINPGARFTFGAHPVYGYPVYTRPGSRPITSSVRARAVVSNRQQSHVASAGVRATQGSRSSVARATNQRAINQRGSTVGNHIFARHDTSWHHDWDHRSAHYWNGHWWCYDGSAWIGLDAGFYPWDYYPYYAYDYYPYDYYPGYYADVEPEYSDAGVSGSVDQSPDPNVTAVQTDLTKLGYYHGPIDGLFGRDTRDALAHYQTDQHLAVTGTLTTETLQSLGV